MNGITAETTFGWAGAHVTTYRCSNGHKVSPSTARGETACALCEEEATRARRLAEREAWLARLSDNAVEHFSAVTVRNAHGNIVRTEPARDMAANRCEVGHLFDGVHNQVRPDGTCSTCARKRRRRAALP